MQQQFLSQGMIPSQAPALDKSLPFLYSPAAGTWDEMIDQHGAIRPHWKKFHSMLQNDGVQSMDIHERTVARLLRDHGVTYNAYQDTGAAGRPWNLDVIPVLLSANDFSEIEKGMQQRVRLFRAILADIYGPQRILHDGLIPPRMLFANPGYLRAAKDIEVESGLMSTIATDLIRAEDGSWLALADRTQMPSGLGYSLENRIVLSQAYPREFKNCRIQRLAAFFERERDHFRELAPAYRRQLNVVMVTPGPQHRSYFEHAFKARYLGFPLVEGADLTVRDRRLYVKTLEGLRQVDVLVRRMEDHSCDSLELEADSWSGIPGLLESWRAGKVSITNGIGSGLLEAPAWLPFLPSICQSLLGEDLLIPAVPTWWCGQKNECEMVMNDPRKWVFKRAFYDTDRPAQSASSMTEGDLKQLLASIQADPEQWVAQQSQTLSTAPMWVDGALQPRPFVLRTFALGTMRDCFVMPGGLGRVSPEKAGFLVTINAGAISKDVWVQADGEVDQKTLLGGHQEVLRIARPPGDVPSRIADHLFWLGRYAERLEQTSRVLRMLSQRLTGEGSEDQMREIAVGLRLAKEIKLLDTASDNNAQILTIQEEIHALLEDPKREGGIADLLGRLRFNAASARDRLSDDTWRLFNRLMDETLVKISPYALPDMIAKLDRIILDMAAFSGMQLENMVQGHGWRFLEIGRRIERGMASASFNHAAIEISTDDDAVLGPMLEIFDSTMTYRRHHFARPKLLLVLDLLILNAANPRSLHYQLEAMHRQVKLLPDESSLGGELKAREEIEDMIAAVNKIDLKSIENNARKTTILLEFCEYFSAQLEKFSDHLTEDYFSHTTRRSR